LVAFTPETAFHVDTDAIGTDSRNTGALVNILTDISRSNLLIALLTHTQVRANDVLAGVATVVSGGLALINILAMSAIR
jgi:hypothetical protein